MVRLNHLLAIAAAFLPVAVGAQIDDEIPQRSAPEPGDPEARRKALNEEQVARATADMETFLERRRAREAAIATIEARKARDDAAFDEATRQHEAELAAYQAARTEWERTNPACKRRDPIGCPAP